MRAIGPMVVSVLLVGGCTLLAGIDGEYVVGGACVPGQERACYSGPAGTEGVGVCKGGVQRCTADGSGFGACEAEVTPGSEACATEADEDCDGKTPACVCVPMAEEICYSGIPSTKGVGPCTPGQRVCNELGTGYGPCEGEVVPKAEVCASGDDESCDGVAECTGTHVWSKRFGDASGQQGTSVTTDSAGNVVLTGFFAGTVDFGDGPLTSAGGDDDDIFVAKLDPLGGHVWSMRFGDVYGQQGGSVTTDSAGNVVLTGWFGGAVDFGGGPLKSEDMDDTFVAKLDPSGGHVWSKRFGGIKNQYALSLTTDSADSVVLTGTCQRG